LGSGTRDAAGAALAQVIKIAPTQQAAAKVRKLGINPNALLLPAISRDDCMHRMIGLYSKDGTQNRFARYFGHAK
jgi:hypothetical protein